MSDPRIVMGRYAFIAKLGEGGMGAVYRVRDLKLERDVAMKILTDSSQVSSVDRFQREARALAQLRDPRVVQVYDNGVLPDGRPFLVTEFVEGRPLDALLKEGPLPPERVRALFADLAQGLAHAHERDVLHRDLKPQNIMIRKDGAPVILDFGLAQMSLGGEEARLTQEGTSIGTPAYMSPEQGNGEVADSRTDVYGLGATLYHALTGRAPFEGESRYTIIKQVFMDAPADPRSLAPQTPPGLARLCLTCLAKEPEDRPPSMKAIAAALEPQAPRSRLFVLGLILVILALLALIAGGAWWVWGPVPLELRGGDPETLVHLGEEFLGRFREDGRFVFERARGSYILDLERAGVRVKRRVRVGEAAEILALEGRLEVEGPPGWKASLATEEGRPGPFANQPLPVDARLLMGRYQLIITGSDPLEGEVRDRSALAIKPGESRQVSARQSSRELQLTNRIWSKPVLAELDGDGEDDLVVAMWGFPPDNATWAHAVALSSKTGRELWRRKPVMGRYRRPLLTADGQLVFAENSPKDGARTTWLDARTGKARQVWLGRAFLSKKRRRWVGPVPVSELRRGGERFLAAVGFRKAESVLDLLLLDDLRRARVSFRLDNWTHKFQLPLMVSLDGSAQADDALVLEPTPRSRLRVYKGFLDRSGLINAPDASIPLEGKAPPNWNSDQLSPDGRALALAVYQRNPRRLDLRVLDLASLNLGPKLPAPAKADVELCWLPESGGSSLVAMSSPRGIQQTWIGLYRGSRPIEASFKGRGLMIGSYRPEEARTLILLSLMVQKRRSRLVLLDPEKGLAEVWRSAELAGPIRFSCADLDHDGRDEILAWSDQSRLLIGRPRLFEKTQPPG